MDYKVIDYKWLDKDDKKIALILNNDNLDVGDTVNYKINGKSYEICVMSTLYDTRKEPTVIGMIIEYSDDNIISYIINNIRN